MKFDQNSFCVAPWFQIRNGQDGRYSPCCELQPNLSDFTGQTNLTWPESSPQDWMHSDYAAYLRTRISQGTRLPECERCWRKESAGAPSLRQILNNTLTNGRGHELNQTWLTSFFKTADPTQRSLVFGCDVKINNLCNYACIMCDPEDSTQILTKWIKSREIPIIQERLLAQPGMLDRAQEMIRNHDKYKFLLEVIDLGPMHIKILGGEPLIDKTLLEILDNVPRHKKQKIKLLFVTNGSVDLLETKKRFNDWKDVLFVVSLEGTHDVQDYLRQGSVWTQIEANMKTYVGQSHRQLSIHSSIQSFSLSHLPALLQFAQSLSVPVTVSTVDNPDYLSLAAIPDVMKPGIFEKLCSSKTALSAEHKKLVDALISWLEKQKWNPDCSHRKSQYLAWYDPGHHWRDIFPEWVDHLR